MTHMRTDLTVTGAVLLPAATLVLASEPAAADDPPPICPSCGATVTPTSEGFLARVRSDVDTLNSAAGDPQPCMAIPFHRDLDNDGRPDDSAFDADGRPIQVPGVLRWRSTLATEAEVDRTMDGTEQGTWDRLECWSEQIADDQGAGAFRGLREFMVAPPALAALALDEALQRIPGFRIDTSPASPSLVGMDTWYWAAAIDDGDISAPE